MIFSPNRFTLWWIMRRDLAMLIRGETVGVCGGAADAARYPAIPAAALPTLLLGGILLLIGP
jgi:hypothetical protein